MARINQSALKTGKSILLIDDQEDYRISTAVLLEREGHEVVTAASGEEGIKLVKERYFDLLLLDYYMPGGLSGEETVKKIRIHNPYIQIILQTGYAGEIPPREMLKKLDIQGYHDKSDGPEKLLLWTDIGIKAAFTVQHLNKSRHGLKYILDITPELHKFQLLQDLLQGILLQVSGLLGIMNSFIAVFSDTHYQENILTKDTQGFLALVEESGLIIKASTGKFLNEKSLEEQSHPVILEVVKNALKQKKVKINSSNTIIPLTIGEETLGIIYLEESIFLKQDMELLNIFANQAAVAIQNTRLYEMATFDPLTGIYVRRFFDQCMIRELRTALRSNQSLTLIMLDMNNLKTINDTFGHIAGDQALSTIGKVLRQSTRTSDFPCRYGGDEFAVLLTNTSIEQSKIVIDRIINTLKEKFISESNKKMPITVSIGVGGLSGHNLKNEEIPHPVSNIYIEDLSKLLVNNSDEMLYKSKKDKNNAVFFNDEMKWPAFENNNQ